jgi:hypothetical protein
VDPHNFAVLDELAAVGGGDSFLNFADKPLVATHQALDGLEHPRLGFAASLGRKLREFGLQIGFKRTSIECRVGFAGRGVNI